MKFTKRQLRRIIKEERAKLLNEESRERKEGRLLADLDSIASSVEELAKGLYGVDDDVANDLELQVSRMNKLFEALEDHFVDLELETAKEFDSRFIDMTDPRELR